MVTTHVLPAGPRLPLPPVRGADMAAGWRNPCIQGPGPPHTQCLAGAQAPHLEMRGLQGPAQPPSSCRTGGGPIANAPCFSFSLCPAQPPHGRPPNLLPTDPTESASLELALRRGYRSGPRKQLQTGILELDHWPLAGLENSSLVAGGAQARQGVVTQLPRLSPLVAWNTGGRECTDGCRVLGI